MDLFEEKNIKPMLLYETKPFNDKNYIYELKFDGARCLAYLDKDKTILRNKRNKDVTYLYPELKNMYKQTTKRCILDGELVVFKNKVPNFFLLQKRALLNDKFKIKLESKKNKVEFVAYDILYYDDKQITDLPLLERKKYLNKVKEGNNLSISKYIEENGIEFFNLVKKHNLEGIVAKKKNSLYFIDKRSRNWLKIKSMIEEELIICGYTLNDDNNIKDIILGYFENNILKHRGNISIGISNDDKKIILNIKKVNNPYFKIKKDNIIWIKLELVCKVEYMMLTKTNNMRQAKYKGIIDDKTVDELKRQEL